MKKRVTQFLNKNKIIYDKQFGFRVGYSTSDAVLEFVDRCTSALEKKLYTVAIFHDLSKAYDTVNRDILMGKMNRMGFRGGVADWFHSYLTERRMYVDVSGTYSDIKTVNLGLPQGSVTSPYLFSLYINDMHRCSDKLSFIHFADDTTLYMSGDNLDTLCRDINVELRRVSNWLRSNRLSLNTDKTKYMIFSHKKFSAESCPVFIDGKPITHATSVKFLGLTIDNKLNYNEHVTILTRKLSCAFGIIRKVSHYCSERALKMLYFSLFYSRLIYGISVWEGFGLTNIAKVTKINGRISSWIVERNGGSFEPAGYNAVYKYFLLKALHKCMPEIIIHISATNYITLSLHIIIVADRAAMNF